MNTAYIENLSKYGKSSYDTVKDLFAINTRCAEQLFEQQLALISTGVEYVTSQVKLAGSVKGYKEIVDAQPEMASLYSSKILGITRNVLDITTESRDEVGAWFEKGVKDAEKSIKEVAKVVPLTTKAA